MYCKHLFDIGFTIFGRYKYRGKANRIYKIKLK
jgi:hypothetical protein